MKTFIMSLILVSSFSALAQEIESLPFKCQFQGEYKEGKREILKSTTVNLEKGAEKIVEVELDGVSCSTVAIHRSYGHGIDGLSVKLPDGTLIEDKTISMNPLSLTINKKILCKCGSNGPYDL